MHSHCVRFLNNGNSDGASPSLPPSIILYLLWKPNTYPTPRSFADGPLSECVRQCLIANGDDVGCNELEHARMKPLSTFAPRRQTLDGMLNSPTRNGSSYDEMFPSEEDSPTAGETNNLHSEEGTQQVTKIYVVVDRLSPADDGSSHNGALPNLPDLFQDHCVTGNEANEAYYQPISPEEEQERLLNQHKNEVKTAESLARAVVSSRFLRNRIEGISIGITSDSRAAPGLECCMDAVGRGAKERRKVARNTNGGTAWGNVDDSLKCLRDRSPERSPVAIVTCQPDDLELDDIHSHHHHHEQKDILQSRISAEWNGKGDHKTFSDRAMGNWRQVWCGNDDGGQLKLSARGRPRVPRIRNKVDLADEDELNFDEPVSTAMVTVFLVGVVAYLWNQYGAFIISLLHGEIQQQ